MLTELDKAGIEEVLYRNFLGRIGCRDANKMYILPVYYHYRDGVLLCRSYEGAKVSVMRASPEVCFEVEEIRGAGLWKTVLCQGTYKELTTKEDIAEVQLHLSDIVLAGKAALSSPPPAETTDGQHESAGIIIYYSIHIHEWSGRHEQPA